MALPSREISLQAPRIGIRGALWTPGNNRKTICIGKNWSVLRLQQMRGAR
jgi:hypothetical protein